MKAGPILAIIILLGYVGFELYTLSRLGYRMEPLYIFERFAAVEHAMERCGEADADLQNRFTRNRATVQSRARRELVEQNPEQSPEMIDRLMAEIIQSQEAEVDALIAELGCDDIEIFKLTRGYENRARLNLG